MTVAMDTAKKRQRERTVFYSVAAQWDNLGDIEIRNAALGWIRASGSEVIAFTGSMPESYLDAFDVDDTVRWERSAFRYQIVLWTHILRRRASIVFAPGPQVFANRLRPLLKSSVNWLNVAGVRASGGAVLAVGRSFRGTGKTARALEAAIVRRFQLYSARDTRSAAALGSELLVTPDLAFAQTPEPSMEGGERPLVVLSFRGDRPIDMGGLERLVRRLEDGGFLPTVVTQVKRDDAQHRAIADRFGIPLVSWDDHSHLEQLRRVRETYALSRIVISNRLHALIFGIQAGAAPIAILDNGSDKLLSTLESWFPLQRTDPMFDLSSSIDRPDWDLSEYASAVRNGTAEARRALAGLRAQFLGHLLGESEMPKTYSGARR